VGLNARSAARPTPENYKACTGLDRHSAQGSRVKSTRLAQRGSDGTRERGDGPGERGRSRTALRRGRARPAADGAVIPGNSADIWNSQGHLPSLRPFPIFLTPDGRRPLGTVRPTRVMRSFCSFVSTRDPPVAYLRKSRNRIQPSPPYHALLLLSDGH